MHTWELTVKAGAAKAGCTRYHYVSARRGALRHGPYLAAGFVNASAVGDAARGWKHGYGCSCCRLRGTEHRIAYRMPRHIPRVSSVGCAPEV